MGKDDFLKILLVELSNQDPTSPLKDRDFIAQMTQFSNLEQMIQLGNSFDSFSNSFTAQEGMLLSTLAVGYMGKVVGIDGTNSVIVDQGKATPLRIDLEKDAHIKLVIKNGAGETVKEVDAGDLPKGESQYVLADTGGVPDGIYTMDVIATDTEGNSVSAKVSGYDKVVGVSFKDNKIELMLASGNTTTIDKVETIMEG
jgi:flagellar basal-body rod modification protein FlgD